jgi:arylsulfatase A-like enzyme
MRVLYIDIDTLRPDHLGCYGYPRATSPNIDRVAADGVRFERCYVSDSPCLPSRTALFSGRFGINNGVISHGGAQADFFHEGRDRGFISRLARTSWPARMRRVGMKTATISTFGERHSAWHWYAGFQEVFNVGKFGLETADEVSPIALDWLDRNGRHDDWFLHFHVWDPHTPYRAPESFGQPFRDEPAPDWIDEETRARHWEGVGPHSAREVVGFGVNEAMREMFPRQPLEIGSLDAVRAMHDGYDTGIRYADTHIGRVLDKLAELGVLDETAVLIASDHGETLGEFNIYCDHHLADEHTNHIPFVMKWPGLEGGRVDRALHYHVDVAATVLELLGAKVPDNWDGRSFAPALRDGRDDGRDSLVLSQGAWTCQRSLRFDDYLYLQTLHDGFHELPDEMLFDVSADLHELHDLRDAQPDVVRQAASQLAQWRSEQLRDHPTGTDPMQTVLDEGGPWHVRGHLPRYLERLRATGRAAGAQRLARRYPDAATA